MALSYSVQIMDDGVIPVTPTDVPVDALVTPSGLIPISPAAMERCHWFYSFFLLLRIFLSPSGHTHVWGGTQDPNIVTSRPKIFSSCCFHESEDSVFCMKCWSVPCRWNLWWVLCHWKLWYWYILSKSQLSVIHSRCDFSLKFSGALDVWSSFERIP